MYVGKQIILLIQLFLHFKQCLRNEVIIKKNYLDKKMLVYQLLMILPIFNRMYAIKVTTYLHIVFPKKRIK